MKQLQFTLILALVALSSVSTSIAAPLPQENPALAEPAELESEEEPEEEEELEEMETDRDTFTPATSTVTKGFSIFESSYSFIDNRDVAETRIAFPKPSSASEFSKTSNCESAGITKSAAPMRQSPGAEGDKYLKAGESSANRKWSMASRRN